MKSQYYVDFYMEKWSKEMQYLVWKENRKKTIWYMREKKAMF